MNVYMKIVDFIEDYEEKTGKVFWNGDKEKLKEITGDFFRYFVSVAQDDLDYIEGVLKREFNRLIKEELGEVKVLFDEFLSESLKESDFLDTST